MNDYLNEKYKETERLLKEYIRLKADVIDAYICDDIGAIHSLLAMKGKSRYNREAFILNEGNLY